MIHSTAIIDKSAVIGQDVEIGPYAVIGENVTIGDGTFIGAHATIECAKIGQNCKIFSHASIGAAPQDLKYAGEKTIAIIGDGTTVREFATINRGTSASGQTVVGKNCLIMTCAHVAHDCILGDNCAIAGHVEVGDGVVMGGLTAVHQFVKIGKNVVTGGGSMVSMDIIPYMQAQGDRASLFGLNLVGLKRKRVPIAEIENIKHAYKILFASHLTLNDAVAKIEEELSSSIYVKDIIDFIKKSQRGICRPK